LKLLRLRKVFILLDPMLFKVIVRDYYRSKMRNMLKKMEKEQIVYSYVTREDHNYITRQIVISYAFRVARLILIIFSVSYFIGTVWYIYCRFSSEGQVSMNSTFYTYYSFNEWQINGQNIDS
jgi:hypothetical protein